MIVYYRIADVKLSASKPPPIYENNCYDLTKFCLERFIDAFKKIGPKMVFICDYCGPEYKDLIEDIVPFDYDIHNTASGINETCLYQYTLFEETKEDKVLFQEYDYLYLPNTGGEIEKAIEAFDFITPYDHLDKYTEGRKVEGEILNNRIWQKVESTTATFGCTRDSFMKYKEIFYDHGYIDHRRWLEVGKEGGTLYSPVPSIATHMVTEYMAPYVDWNLQT